MAHLSGIAVQPEQCVGRSDAWTRGAVLVLQVRLDRSPAVDSQLVESRTFGEFPPIQTNSQGYTAAWDYKVRSLRMSDDAVLCKEKRCNILLLSL